MNSGKNVYKEDKLENIKMFSDLKSPTRYSNYSEKFNRIFGEKSYLNFLKNLKHRRLYINSNNFLEAFNTKKDKDQFYFLKKHKGNFNLKEFKKYLNDLQLKNKKLQNLETNPNNRTEDKIKIKISEVPEVGRYNPNFDILYKHISQVTIDPPIHNKEKKFKSNNLTLAICTRYSNKRRHISDLVIDNYKFKSKSHGRYKSNITEPNNIVNSISQKILKNSRGDKPLNNLESIQNSFSCKNNLDSSIHLSPSKFYIKHEDRNNNHCLKFESYSNRKSIITPFNYNTENKSELINYYSPKYIKGNINFEKMSTNQNDLGYFDKVIKASSNPPLGFYQPNYDSILSKNVDIYINKKESTSSNLIKIRKVACSYSVPIKYKLINNDILDKF